MPPEFKGWGLVLLCCVGSRLFSAIYYIEDLDSLRFALSIVDYDVAKRQPHFPAYPVFCWTAKLLSTLIGRYALAFSLIGGVSTFFTIFYTLKIAKIHITTLLGKIAIFLIFMNPLLYLMSNRYMPDAMGVACVLASLYWTLPHQPYGRKAVGFFLAGMSLGIRLSYFPLLIPVLLIRLKETERMTYIIGGSVGGLVWFIPLLWITGWSPLIAAAETHSHGHFSDFGGTVATHPQLSLRFIKILESLWADGFGLYWQGRHPITACTALALIGSIGFALLKRWKSFRAKTLFLNPIFIGGLLYCVWIFFAQNVIHKSRHILPLLPFLALGIAFACSRFIETYTTGKQKGGCYTLAFGTVMLFFLCYSYITLHTVVQHTKPTAIAQIHAYLYAKQREQTEPLHIVAVPLIQYYLASQAIEAVYMPVKSEADLAQLDTLQTGVIVIGSPLPNRIPKAEKVFTHNPYVNRMWPEVHVFEY